LPCVPQVQSVGPIRDSVLDLLHLVQVRRPCQFAGELHAVLHFSVHLEAMD
jgi:hypothetical protein